MSRRHLGLIKETETLTGKGPAGFERLARACVPHSSDHAGVVAICIVLSSRVIGSCIPPSCQSELKAGIDILQSYVKADPGRRPELVALLEQARLKCFQAAPAIESKTAQVVLAAQVNFQIADSDTRSATPLDPHADHVVERYARLAAHFSCAAICHSLDAAATPASALEVIEDVRGARAYQLTGLGAARQPALRAAALDQAKWEAARLSHAGQTENALAVQVFHEYLGGRYRNYAEAETQMQNAFISWALSGRSLPIKQNSILT